MYLCNFGWQLFLWRCIWILLHYYVFINSCLLLVVFHLFTIAFLTIIEILLLLSYFLFFLQFLVYFFIKRMILWIQLLEQIFFVNSTGCRYYEVLLSEALIKLEYYLNDIGETVLHIYDVVKRFLDRVQGNNDYWRGQSSSMNIEKVKHSLFLVDS